MPEDVPSDVSPTTGPTDASTAVASPPATMTHHRPWARGSRRTAVIAIAAIGVAATGGAIAVASTHPSHGVQHAGARGLAEAETSTAAAATSTSGASSNSRAGSAHHGGSGTRAATAGAPTTPTTPRNPVAGALHGTFTVSDASTEELMQTGSVTAVSSGSLTVTSKDGFVRTYVLTKDTSYAGGHGAAADIKKGASVTVLAPDTATLTATIVDNRGAQSPPSGATGVAPSTVPNTSASGAPTTVSGGGGKPPAGGPGPGGSGSGSGAGPGSGGPPSETPPAGAPTALPTTGSTTSTGSTSGNSPGTTSTTGAPRTAPTGAGPGTGTAGLLADIEYGTFVMAAGSAYVTDTVMVGTVTAISSSAITIEAKNATSTTFTIDSATHRDATLTQGTTATVVAEVGASATYALAGSIAGESGQMGGGGFGAPPATAQE